MSVFKAIAHAIIYGLLLQIIEGAVYGVVLVFADTLSWLGVLSSGYFTGWDFNKIVRGAVGAVLLRYVIGLNGPVQLIGLYFYFRENNPLLDGRRSLTWLAAINFIAYAVCVLIFFTWSEYPVLQGYSNRVNYFYVIAIASLISPYVLVSLATLIRHQKWLNKTIA